MLVIGVAGGAEGVGIRMCGFIVGIAQGVGTGGGEGILLFTNVVGTTAGDAWKDPMLLKPLIAGCTLATKAVAIGMSISRLITGFVVTLHVGTLSYDCDITISSLTLPLVSNTAVSNTSPSVDSVHMIGHGPMRSSLSTSGRRCREQ